MRQADLSLTVSQRKPACVLDPMLVLGHAQGLTLALRLGRVFEAWLTRSFWQLIDSSELLYAHAALPAASHLQPHLQLVLQGASMGLPTAAALAAPEAAAGGDAGAAADPMLPDPQALAAWLAMRERTDAGSWTLRWVGDCMAESQLQDGADAALLDRYEQLAAGLFDRLPNDACGTGWRAGLDPVSGAIDSLALSASLDGALVLCPAVRPVLGPADGRQGDARAPSAQSAQGRPWPVQALDRLGLPAVLLDPMPATSLFDAERAWLRQALAAAGLAALAECQPRWAALHVIAEPLGDGASNESSDPWAAARAWWYWV